MALYKNIFQFIKKLNSRLAGSYSYLLLTIAGLSFCFFLGFPFGKHNETYIWVVMLKKASLHDALTRQLTGGIETFRPLGMATAWISYRLSGNIYLQQIINWLFAIGSFTTLFIYSGNKVLFSIIAFITCICFFSGYIYLFHLHGVFYGPFQFYTASLICIASQRSSLSFRMIVILAIATVIISLYHTFALPVFCAFLCGYLIQSVKTGNKIISAALLILLFITAGFAKLILYSKEFKPLSQLLQGFFASYRVSEFSQLLSIISLLLSMITVISMVKKTATQLLLLFILIVAAELLNYYNIPVITLWITTCFIKPLLKGNWAMAALIAITAILPAASGTGSPTYNVFAIMACLFVTAQNNTLFTIAPAFTGKLALATSICLLCAVLPLLKYNMRVPVVSAIAKPVLAEQEKTRQLEDIIAWKIKDTQFKPFNLEFTDAADMPVNSSNTINRQNRPVTGQLALDFYMDNVSTGTISAKTQQLYITFGDKILKDKMIVFAVEGKWNGKAYVFR